jgi:putative flippase GtrA
MTTLTLHHPVPRLPRPSARTVRQVARYAVVGGLSTVLSSLLYLLFRSAWDAVPANVVAIVLSTVASTEANRRFTFGGAAADRLHAYVQNAGTALFYIFYSSAVLLVLDQVVDAPTAVQESAAVAVASVLGGAVRYLVLRHWVFAAGHTAPHAT